ncbi:MAG: hypothetical protein HXY36_02045 [Chloroflexi bacterium]|nr:hypothetical protein [Chloroflexota bacterium]
MEKKYRFLPFAARVLRIVGWIILVVGVIGSIVYGIVMGSAANGTAGGLAGGLTGFFIAVVGVIFSFLTWVFSLASSELIYLFMDVEENTRNTAEGIAIIKEKSRQA